MSIKKENVAKLGDPITREIATQIVTGILKDLLYTYYEWLGCYSRNEAEWYEYSVPATYTTLRKFAILKMETVGGLC